MTVELILMAQDGWGGDTPPLAPHMIVREP